MYPRKKHPPELSHRQVQKQANTKVFSYYSNRPTDSVQRSGTRHEDSAVDMRRVSPMLKLKNAPMILAFVTILACIGYNFFLSTDPRILVQGEAAQKTLLQDTDKYEAAIHEELMTTPLNRTKVTFNVAKTSDNLSNQFPELSSVNVTLPLMGIKPVVHLQPATPVLILVTASGLSYIVDVDGKVISTNIAKVPQDIPIVNDRSGLEVELGKHVLARADVRFIEDFKYQLDAKGLAIESLLLPAGTHELQVRLKDTSYYIRTSLREDAVHQAGTLIATLKYLEGKGATPKTYVDIRISERIFYK